MDRGSGGRMSVSCSNGIAQGFLFRAFSKDRSTLYVSNLTLLLPYAGAQPAIDSAWTLLVKSYTVSKLPAQILSSQNDQGNNEGDNQQN